MSLTKILKSSIKLFQKEVITFVRIRRNDLGIVGDKLRYISVKPNASITTLRYKVWHLLDLPDYCDELIILKSDDVEIPLTELRKGNDPQKPYLLEVWLPEKMNSETTLLNNMLTMGDAASESNFVSDSECMNRSHAEKESSGKSVSSVTTALKQEVTIDNQGPLDHKSPSEHKSELSCRISNSSFLFKLPCKKKDSFTNILLKIQSDLCNLSNKLSNLENKIRV